jgi:hypothetical protein
LFGSTLHTCFSYVAKAQQLHYGSFEAVVRAGFGYHWHTVALAYAPIPFTAGSGKHDNGEPFVLFILFDVGKRFCSG